MPRVPISSPDMIQMFCLGQKSPRHSPLKMQKTFARLGTYMAKNKTNLYIVGWKTTHEIQDAIAHGLHLIMTEGDIEGGEEVNTREDGMEVVEDEGDLE